MRTLLIIALMIGGLQSWAQEIPQRPKKTTPNTTTPTTQIPTTQKPNKNTVVTTTKDCDWGDCKNGYGKKTYSNGDYIGFWSNGLKEGYGSYYWTKSKGQYIGSWESDKMSGYGVYISDDNDNLRGQYRDGKMNGIGVTVRDNKWEQGIFKDGNISQHFNYYSNNKTSGCTIGDCQNGYGKWVYSNGDNYIGFFNNGNLKQGTYTFTNGAKYSGEFNSSNQMHGMGRYWASDKSYYGGEWRNGKFHGRGYYDNKATGKKEVGVWTNGTLTQSMY